MMLFILIYFVSVVYNFLYANYYDLTNQEGGAIVCAMYLVPGITTIIASVRMYLYLKRL